MNAIPSTRSARQTGFTLIELLVALFIGLFLVGGMMILVQDNKRTSTTQNQMTKLQDDERLALTMMTDVIQQAGYYPDPTANTPSSMLPTSAVLYGAYYANQIGFSAAGQSLFGYHNVTNPINVLANSDSIDVRFATASGDGILNCFGAPNTSGAIKNNANFFFTFNGQLWCETEAPTAVPLVGDAFNTNTANPVSVTQLGILYGVNTSGTGSFADTYKSADQMTAADWNNVISVQVTLTFTNPLYGPSNPTEPQTVAVSRVISVMREAGI